MKSSLRKETERMIRIIKAVRGDEPLEPAEIFMVNLLEQVKDWSEEQVDRFLNDELVFKLDKHQK